jgi:hypothetical protein
MSRILMKRKTIQGLLVACTFACALISCGDEKVDAPPVPIEQLVSVRNDSIFNAAKALIKTGDLVLRTGKDFSSEQVKGFSKTDKTYSHGGIAVVEGDSIFIYHVEPDYYYVNDKVRKESLDSFCNPAKNYGIGVARYDMSPEENVKLIAYMDEQYRKKIPFDVHFELKTDDKMYCSEMIKKGLAKATANRINIEVQPLNDKSKYRLIKRYFKLTEKQFVNREIIPIDRLFLNPACTVLQRFVYDQP